MMKVWKWSLLSLPDRLDKKMQPHESWADSCCLTCVQKSYVSICSQHAGRHLYSQWLMNFLGNFHDLSLGYECSWLYMDLWKHMDCSAVLYAIIKFNVSSRNLAPCVTDDETWWTVMNMLSAWSQEGCSRVASTGQNVPSLGQDLQEESLPPPATSLQHLRPDTGVATGSGFQTRIRVEQNMVIPL